MGAAVDGPEAAIKELGLIIEEARIGLALSDCCNVNEFAMRKPVLSGLVALWADRNDIPNKGGAN